jgi:DNA-binding NarL/FixJ family response regulator
MPATGPSARRALNGSAYRAHEYLMGNVEASLLDALRITLDSLSVGVIIVDCDARILHANQAARTMLDARSPIISLGGSLCASQANLTNELRQAIAMMRAIDHSSGTSTVGVPLVNKDMTAATAHVLPLVRHELHGDPAAQPTAAVFVASGSTSSRIDVGTVGRIFKLTPAENRLLGLLHAGKRITEAAAALGVTEATAKCHLSHIFSKSGVSRWTDLMILIDHLIPPLCPSQSC